MSRSSIIFAVILMTLVAWLCPRFSVLAVESKDKDLLDYNRDVRPILSEHCFACHGFDEKSREADLRLDLAESAYADRDGTVAVKPGRLDESEAWLRIISDDEDTVMPPPTVHATLDDQKKQTLREWIEQGAHYAGHWSFIAPVKGPLPESFANESPIDAFVLHRLADQGIAPAGQADRATLIRRLSLDLTGLPPTGDEVTSFMSDGSPDAYEDLVDRLLESPAFGERLAIDWLDAARYADTNGFSIDGGRHLWLWRDWVIQSFNDNLPYDQFVVQQLAGDLLPGTDDAMKIATGFQRNNMVTHEGGTIPEENLTNYNVDRVKTLGESIMGLTLACAQCHDHKYDPISQKDYYQLFAFFNTLSDKGLDANAGVNPGPSIQAKTVLRTDELDSLIREIAEIERRLANPNIEILPVWEQREKMKQAMRGKDFATHPLKVVKVSTPNRGTGFEVEDEQFVRLPDTGALAAFDISTELPKLDRPITGVRVVVHPVADLPGGGWGNGPVDAKAAAAKKSAAKAAAESDENVSTVDPKEPQAKGTFMLTALASTADSVPGDQVNLFKLLNFSRVTANSWEIGHPPAHCLDPRNDDGWSPDLTSEGPVHITATFESPIDSTATPYLTVQLNFGNGRSLIPQLVELQVITGHDDGTELPKDVLTIIESEPADRTAEQTSALWTYCAAHAEELQRDRTHLANLRERAAVLTQPFTTMVMDVAAKPRETFILNRGDYMQPTEKVEADTIASLPAMPKDAPRDRLGLAQWLVSPEHPLTARVAVNRIWKILFGTGLVATAADFGSQGEWPSHPELLDWLAVDFHESGWNVKSLVKQIVMSKTYRLDSRTTKEQLEADPQNRLLARGTRFRLPAEFIRDAALKTSGLLVGRIGGPSVNPYMPGDLWREVSHYGSTPATAQTFVQDHGEKLYRRSLYTFWKRTAPPPNMVAFDAPSREVCSVDRGNTTTPLQALVTLNDVQFVEASRAFASKILSSAKPGPSSDEDRIRWAFLEATSRPVTDRELEILSRTLTRERNRYENDLDSAHKYLSVGESPLPESIPVDELAAWSQFSAVLLNLSESVSRP
jgi:hypothetical protein